MPDATLSRPNMSSRNRAVGRVRHQNVPVARWPSGAPSRGVAVGNGRGGPTAESTSADRTRGSSAMSVVILGPC